MKNSLDLGDSVDIRAQLRNNGNHTERCKTAWKPQNASKATLFEKYTPNEKKIKPYKKNDSPLRDDP
jgi:hypothetical protein